MTFVLDARDPSADGKPQPARPTASRAAAVADLREPAASLPPLVRILPLEARRFFAERLVTREAKAGEVLAAMATPCSALWFFESGLVDVQLLSPSPTAPLGAGPLLRAGDFYGVHSTAESATHSATLMAVSDTIFVELSSEALREAAASFPAVASWLEHILRNRPVARLLAHLASSMPGEEPILLPLAERLARVSVARGQCVQAAGAAVEVFGVVESGALSARLPSSHLAHDNSATRLGPASLVAATALLLETASPLRVEAENDVQLLILPRAGLNELFRAAPALRKAIAELAASGLDVQSPSTNACDIDRSCEVRDAQRALDEELVTAGPSQPGWWRRVPHLRQREQMDCGAACLRMIHAHFGQEIGYREARQLARVSRYGTSLMDLRDAAERLGYVAEGVEAKTWDSVAAVRLPAVAHVDKNHFVVVWRASGRKVQISDPAIGKTWIKKQEFLDRFGGFLLLLRPTDAVSRAKKQALARPKTRERDFSLLRLLPFARPYWRVFGYVLLASFLLQLFGVLTPLLTQVIIDRVIGHGEVRLLNVVFAALVLSTVFSGLVSFSRNHLMVHAATGIERTLLEAVYQRILSMASSFFSRFTTGDLVRRFGEVDEVKNFFSNNAVAALLDMFMVATYAAVLLWMQPALTGVYIVVLASSSLVAFAIARPVRGHTQAFVQKFSLVNTHVIDSFKGIDPVKAMALERPFHRWYSTLLAPSLEHSRKAAGWALASGVFIQLIDGLNSGLVLWRGAYLVLAGTLTLGQLMAFLMLSRQLTGPFLRLLGQWGDFQRTLVSLNRVGDLLDELPEAEQQEGRGAMIELHQPRGEIRLENVSFRYTGDPKDGGRNVIDNLDLRIAPGEVIGIVGRSGCGKSTLARLLLKFEEPTLGRITLDGIHLRDLDPQSLRRQIGLVTQEAVLYSGTIRDNIVCGRQEVTEQDLIRAAQAAGAYDFICELPYGFETRIGDQGMKLSGGQCQRIVIARALCTSPQILIFDEATAALDPLVERDIHQGLREVIRGRTTIIIAHRLNTLRRADRIVVLDRGRLVEQGTHDELMAADGLYRRMYTASPDWHADAAAA